MSPKHLEKAPKLDSGTTTLVGKEGQRVTLALVGHYLGLNKLTDVGPAASYAEDGSVSLQVDEATFDALELPRD